MHMQQINKKKYIARHQNLHINRYQAFIICRLEKKGSEFLASNANQIDIKDELFYSTAKN